MMLMPDGSTRPTPLYLGKPQSEWTEEESKAHAALQQEVLEMQRHLQPVAPHKHRGSVTVDRGETCLDCGRDVSDPVHIG